MSYDNTKKWLENNFTSTLHILQVLYFMGGWVGHVRQWWMAKQKLKLYTSHVTWNPPHTCTQTPSHVWEKLFFYSSASGKPHLNCFDGINMLKAGNCDWYSLKWLPLFGFVTKEFILVAKSFPFWIKTNSIKLMWYLLCRVHFRIPWISFLYLHWNHSTSGWYFQWSYRNRNHTLLNYYQKACHKTFYHMTGTAPRALSLQNYRENPRMRAVRDGVSRAGKSRPALLGSCTALREMWTNFVAI